MIAATIIMTSARIPSVEGDTFENPTPAAGRNGWSSGE
jgi:hypothetical protein